MSRQLHGAVGPTWLLHTRHAVPLIHGRIPCVIWNQHDSFEEFTGHNGARRLLGPEIVTKKSCDPNGRDNEEKNASKTDTYILEDTQASQAELYRPSPPSSNDSSR